MNTVKTINFCLTVLTFVMAMLMTGCNKNMNPVLDYLTGAEVQYEGNTQKATIIIALNDIIMLSEQELKKKKYSDYAGNKNNWDMPTLFVKHFVPNLSSKNLGNSFYRDVKSEEVRVKIKLILGELK